jgi:hypothetical protein
VYLGAFVAGSITEAGSNAASGTTNIAATAIAASSKNGMIDFSFVFVSLLMSDLNLKLDMHYKNFNFIL